MYFDHSRNVSPRTKEQVAIDTSQKVADLARGWSAAEEGQPYDKSQPSAWREGWELRTRFPRRVA